MAGYEDRYWWSPDGLRLHYRDYAGGEAGRPPILCLPGLTRNARDFDELAARLSPRWRVLALDFRGRGESGYAKDPMSYAPLTYVGDVDALLGAFDAVSTSVPSVILCDTKVGRGVPLLENREKAHFMRIDEDEWQICRDQLTEGYQA